MNKPFLTKMLMDHVRADIGAVFRYCGGCTSNAKKTNLKFIQLEQDLGKKTEEE